MNSICAASRIDPGLWLYWERRIELLEATNVRHLAMRARLLVGYGRLGQVSSEMRKDYMFVVLIFVRKATYIISLYSV